jgi:two-component system, response regulator YesN
LADAVRQGDRRAAFQALGEWRRAWGVADAEGARRQAIDLFDELVQHLRQDGFEFREGTSPSPASVHSTVLGLESGAQVEAWLDDQVGALASFVEVNYRSNHRLIIRRALGVIEERYAGDLTAEQVAVEVGLSPNYFSHLFKKVRGQGFKDHLNEVRIRKAEALLATGGRKVYEVAHLVGFADYKYFSAVFKKVTGHSPTRLEKRS